MPFEATGTDFEGFGCDKVVDPCSRKRVMKKARKKLADRAGSARSVLATMLS
jgi:hypothetical protein